MRGNRKQSVQRCSDRWKSQSQIHVHRKHVMVRDEGATETVLSSMPGETRKEKCQQRCKEEKGDNGTSIAERIIRELVTTSRKSPDKS